MSFFTNGLWCWKASSFPENRFSYWARHAHATIIEQNLQPRHAVTKQGKAPLTIPEDQFKLMDHVDVQSAET